MPHSVAFHLSLLCKNTFLQVSSTQRVKKLYNSDLHNLNSMGPGPEVIKLHMFNSTEHEISTAHKN